MRTLIHSSDSLIADHAPGKPGLMAAWRQGIGWVLAASLATLGQPAEAADVYKCQNAGKITYTSNPSSSSGCRLVDLKVIEPNPLEVDRAIQEKERKEEEELAAEERARQERLVRAREIEAQAALRRARAAEEEALRLRQQEAANQPVYPVWGYPILRPRLHSHPHRHPDKHFDHRPDGRRDPPPKGGKLSAPNSELHFSIGQQHQRRK